jgi:CRP-like cAMP-binding protein
MVSVDYLQIINLAEEKRQGDRNRDIFLLLRGTVSVTMPLGIHRRERRLNSISAGVTFGEIALLDGKPRSVDVVAVSETEVYRLPYAKFIELQQSAPTVANKLVLNMALNLSTRLRLNTEEIKVLAENESPSAPSSASTGKSF